MAIYVGVAFKEHDEKVAVAATAWFTNTPVFNTHGMTLERMRDKLLSIVFVENPNKINAINAAVQRTLEKLFIRRVIPLPQAEGNDITLFIPPRLKKHKFVIPHQIETKHWLIRGAARALAEHLGAKNAKRTSKRTLKIEIAKNVLHIAGRLLHVSEIIQLAKRDFEVELARDSIASYRWMTVACRPWHQNQ